MRESVVDYLADRRRQRLALDDDSKRFMDSIREAAEAPSQREVVHLESPAAPSRAMTSRSADGLVDETLHQSPLSSSSLALDSNQRQMSHQAHAFAHENTRMTVAIHELREELRAVKAERDAEAATRATVQESQRRMAADFFRQHARMRTYALECEESAARAHLERSEAELWAAMQSRLVAAWSHFYYRHTDDPEVRSTRLVNDLRGIYDEISHEMAAAPQSSRAAQPLFLDSYDRAMADTAPRGSMVRQALLDTETTAPGPRTSSPPRPLPVRAAQAMLARDPHDMMIESGATIRTGSSPERRVSPARRQPQYTAEEEDDEVPTRGTGISETVTVPLASAVPSQHRAAVERAFERELLDKAVRCSTKEAVDSFLDIRSEQGGRRGVGRLAAGGRASANSSSESVLGGFVPPANRDTLLDRGARSRRRAF